MLDNILHLYYLYSQAHIGFISCRDFRTILHCLSSWEGVFFYGFSFGGRGKGAKGQHIVHRYLTWLHIFQDPFLISPKLHLQGDNVGVIFTFNLRYVSITSVILHLSNIFIANIKNIQLSSPSQLIMTHFHLDLRKTSTTTTSLILD